LGGKRSARSAIASADAAMAEAELAAKQREIATQVASAYLDLFLAQRTQEVDDELDGVLQVLATLSQARIARGKAEQIEFLRAQASLIQIRSDRENAIEHRQSAWARLAELIDRAPDGPDGATSPT